MRNEPSYFLQPVFHFLENLIHENGDYLFMLLVYVSIPLIAWILSGGLRRKQARRDSSAMLSITFLSRAKTST